MERDAFQSKTVQPCRPSRREAEAGGSQVQDKPVCGGLKFSVVVAGAGTALVDCQVKACSTGSGTVGRRGTFLAEVRHGGAGPEGPYAQAPPSVAHRSLPAAWDQDVEPWAPSAAPVRPRPASHRGGEGLNL